MLQQQSHRLEAVQMISEAQNRVDSALTQLKVSGDEASRYAMFQRKSVGLESIASPTRHAQPAVQVPGSAQYALSVSSRLLALGFRQLMASKVSEEPLGKDMLELVQWTLQTFAKSCESYCAQPANVFPSLQGKLPLSMAEAVWVQMLLASYDKTQGNFSSKAEGIFESFTPINSMNVDDDIMEYFAHLASKSLNLKMHALLLVLKAGLDSKRLTAADLAIFQKEAQGEEWVVERAVGFVKSHNVHGVTKHQLLVLEHLGLLPAFDRCLKSALGKISHVSDVAKISMVDPRPREFLNQLREARHGFYKVRGAWVGAVPLYLLRQLVEKVAAIAKCSPNTEMDEMKAELHRAIDEKIEAVDKKVETIDAEVQRLKVQVSQLLGSQSAAAGALKLSDFSLISPIAERPMSKCWVAEYDRTRFFLKAEKFQKIEDIVALRETLYFLKTIRSRSGFVMLLASFVCNDALVTVFPLSLSAVEAKVLNVSPIGNLLPRDECDTGLCILGDLAEPRRFESALVFLAQMVVPLAYLHQQGFVFRDLDVTQYVGTELKVGGWQCLQLELADTSSMVHQNSAVQGFLGKRQWPSPDSGPQTQKSDVYLLGLVACSTLYGFNPGNLFCQTYDFDRQRLPLMRPEVNLQNMDFRDAEMQELAGEAWNLINALLEADPVQRPSLCQVVFHPLWRKLSRSLTQQDTQRTILMEYAHLNREGQMDDNSNTTSEYYIQAWKLDLDRWGLERESLVNDSRDAIDEYVAKRPRGDGLP